MKRWACLFFFVCFALEFVSAQAASRAVPLIGNISGRTTISLNGAWNAIIDPYENGVRSIYKNEVAKNKTDLVEYNFDKSPVLNVPGDWNTQREQFLFYEGPMWYRRAFTYHKRPSSRVFIYFGAVNYFSRIYLNGEKLGEHEGGFTAFNFEATAQLKDGENFLVVEVNNLRQVQTIPTLRYDWWNYGGITRDVLLVEEPQVFVQNYVVQLAKGRQDEVAGWVQLNGASSEQPVTVEIPEAGLRVNTTADASGRASFHFPAKLDLWEPGRPKLYDVTISSGPDTVHDQIGFRSVEVSGNKILLNGKPIFLRGVSYHEEAPSRDGRAFSAEDAQILLGWARDLGCNFVRLAHYPHNENEIRLADRMGLLVWSEIPVYWDIDWTNAATLANAQLQLRDMIARDQNRAAVVMWSMSNETPVKPERTTFITQLAQNARAQDPTRLITSALNHVDETTADVRTISDPLAESLDVIGLNEYLGWYWGRVEDADKMQWKMKYDKPLIVSEFGGGAPFGVHGGADERWTEEYQASLYEHQLPMLEKMPGYAGLTPWVLMDFRSPARMLPGVQDYHNRKGLVSNRGQRKQAFYVLQKYYKSKAADAAKK